MVLRAHWRAAVICVYALSVVLVEILHRPWFDEAQSWLLARDASIPDLFTQRLRYEGSPGLWHLLLLAPARLGLPYRTVSVIGLLAAVTGVVILVRRSPLPWVLTALVPFTYFVLYQYGVVARSYCLLPLLLALLAAGHRGKLDHPWRFAVLLALLANVSLHGLIIAVSLE